MRCNRVDSIGFLDDYRRVNVSLTRARSALFLLGSASTLHSGSWYDGWSPLLSHLSTKQATINVWLKGDNVGNGAAPHDVGETVVGWLCAPKAQKCERSRVYDGKE